ncbi:helix-turn-helix domain-containing protein [Treponema phagedenis]|uniref:Helix-turn-helix transcriptional regulator n=1 Tax=Treponema phagedenis TaxID=162 RepID=A0A7H8VJG4_TREPH|nr:helix-turn-helix transcriptional regulator [Treponema phagedenis]NVP22683.1 helix-turn-helix transcriptional regulator [Treponema phagedenis]NVP23276.1 helix-turn-helix transcriptional regulator [Treponema phagedenis]QEJ98679.1 helix-turn-helix transcriptional regulator [Treponema phagedenis]QEK04185.1 helix-turn-helix transcriptional regulator [Treponema phagedenis]QEK09801.1 helix-turn-helix transcriptional regulator [Treponema phagedenis]
MNDGASFWKRTNTLIKAQNTTQEAIAAKADIKYQTFRNMSAKGTFPRADEAFLIAQSLNVSVEYLITGRHPNNAETVDRTKTLLAEAMRTLDDIK